MTKPKEQTTNESYSTPSRLIFEITTSKDWGNKKPVGIVRTEKKLGNYLIKHIPPEQISFCYYDKKLEAFYEIERKKAIDYLTKIPHTEPIESKSSSYLSDTKVASSKRPNKLLKYQGIIQILKDIRQVFRSTFALMGHFISKITPQNNNSQIISPTGSFSFGNNDVFLYVGVNWDVQQVTRLRALKNLYHFKVVTICYDLIPIRNPQYVEHFFPSIAKNYMVEAIQGADQILCISKYIENDLQKFLNDFKIGAKSTSVIHLGEELECEYNPTKPQRASVLKPNNFTFYVSSLDARKNHYLLYKTWIKLSEISKLEIPYLVFVGRKGWGVDDTLEYIDRDPRVNQKILILTDASDRELAWLYQNCLFTVFPSFDEGWGLPVSESIRYGKLCISSNAASLPEVGGDLVIYIDPYDCIQWAKTIEGLIRNPKKLRSYEQKIKHNYKPWSWDQTGKQVLENIEQLGAKFLC